MIPSFLHRRSVLRAAALLLALLHAGATSVAALDAIMDVESTAIPLHVESQEATHDAAHHDHLFCQVVRSLGNAAGAQLLPTFDAGLAFFVEAEFDRPDVVRSVPRAGLSGPRGPPLA